MCAIIPKATSKLICKVVDAGLFPFFLTYSHPKFGSVANDLAGRLVISLEDKSLYHNIQWLE